MGGAPSEETRTAWLASKSAGNKCPAKKMKKKKKERGKEKKKGGGRVRRERWESGSRVQRRNIVLPAIGLIRPQTTISVDAEGRTTGEEDSWPGNRGSPSPQLRPAASLGPGAFSSSLPALPPDGHLLHASAEMARLLEKISLGLTRRETCFARQRERRPALRVSPRWSEGAGRAIGTVR